MKTRILLATLIIVASLSFIASYIAPTQEYDAKLVLDIVTYISFSVFALIIAAKTDFE